MIGRSVFLTALGLAVGLTGFVVLREVHGQATTEDAKAAALKERDRLWDQTRKLRAEGKTAGGEGLLGLQRAFQVAGARSVVASFWTVNDYRTRDLMERFYKGLWSEKRAKVDALREAQLTMLRDQRRMIEDLDPAERRLPPLDWAAFVLSGDWR
jgi:hypothetical protein